MDPIRIEIPEFALVALVGSTSSGKTTFAHRCFQPTEVLSADFFRGMVSDNPNDQSASQDAFDLLYYAANKRLSNRKLTVIDATNLQQSARKQVLVCARAQDVHPVAIVLNLPEETLLERNRARTDHRIPDRIVRQHARETRRCLKNLRREGFRFLYEITSQEQADHVEIVRTKLWPDRREEHGPFDIIGDVHGCCDELEELLAKLGYQKTDGVYRHPDGRKSVFLGDFTDRGPRSMDVLRLAMDMVQAGTALAVAGNHDVKLLKYLFGKYISRTHGAEETIAALDAQDDAFKTELRSFLDGLVSYYWLDDGKLVVSHAGLKQEYIGRTSGRIRAFCLYGETTGETDQYGLPVRLNWATEYRGSAAVVYGHIARRTVKAENRTYCIDTGCAFGGKLTALRYPEMQYMDVPAKRQYYEPIKPLEEESPEEDLGDLLTIGDYNQKMHIETALGLSVDIRENNAAAALEVMSRFAADPHWLIYLPPTMSPCETSKREGFLEHPLEALAYYRNNGIATAVCEQKHMGSRAVIVLCRDGATAQRRFGVRDGSRGIIYTRTGRAFFQDRETETALLDRLDAVLTATGFWTDLETDWVCLDAELMPWSEKAQGLLQKQYAPTGYAGISGLEAATAALTQAVSRDIPPAGPDARNSVDLNALLTRYQGRLEDLRRYKTAYQQYCWTVGNLEDIRIAPFHILAAEGRVFQQETHVWHMETIRKYITGRDPIYMETPYLVVDTGDETSVQKAVDWWTALTESGGEGMVVKPETFTAWGNGRLLQPAVKCRGREYLRIIYGAEYLQEDHLRRLKVRSLDRKRSLAVKEFSLGMESLTRFVQGEPLYRVHQCAFGVLALESEPVDPRL